MVWAGKRQSLTGVIPGRKVLRKGMRYLPETALTAKEISIGIIITRYFIPVCISNSFPFGQL